MFDINEEEKKAKAKINVEEIADEIILLSVMCFEQYCKVHKKKQMDKAMFASLHIGYLNGMLNAGYKNKEIEKALIICRKELKLT